MQKTADETQLDNHIPAPQDVAHPEPSDGGLRTFSLSRYSVRYFAALLIVTLYATSVTAYAIYTGEYIIAATGAAAAATYIIATTLMMRVDIKRISVERWIHRLSAGDHEYTMEPWGQDELSKVCLALETLRLNAARAIDPAELQQISAELQQERQRLANTVTALRNTQDQVANKQKLAEIGELTAGIAHEVRNPLNIIQNYAQASRSLMDELVTTVGEVDDPDSERTELIAEITTDLKGNLTRMMENCERASRIIQNVSNMSRNQVGPPRPIDLNQLLKDYAALAYQATRSQDTAFNVSFENDLSPDNPVVECVPEELSRVFINIVSNACYATSRRQRKLEAADYSPLITLRTRTEPKFASVEIKDNGTGMPAAALNQAFDPFFTTKPTNEGTGLGLSLSHEIIRRHGGEISIDSVENRYTSVLITLPLTQTTSAAPAAA